MKSTKLLTVMFMLCSSVAFAGPQGRANPKILLSFGNQMHQEMDVKAVRAWTKKVCDQFYTATQLVNSYNVECVSLDDMNDFIDDKIYKAEKSNKYNMHLMFKKNPDQTYTFSVENWLAKNKEDEFHKAQWTIHDKDETQAVEHALGLMTNALSYDSNKKTIKSFFLGGALAESQEIKVDNTGKLIAVSDGRVLSDEEAYDVFINEKPKFKHYMRAASEIGVALGLGTLNYWSYTLFADKNPNEQDWHFDGKEGQIRKYRGFGGVRYDDNSRDTNIGHSLAGMMYYQIARSNGFTSTESFLTALTASTFWETVSEYREVISINDQFFTAVGGFIIGETLTQFSRYFYAKGTLPGKVLSAIFDGPAALNRLLDGKMHKRSKREMYQYGFDPEALGAFNFYVGKSVAPESASGVYGAAGEINNIRLFDEPGYVQKVYTDTALSQLVVEMTKNDKVTEGLDVLLKSVFAAYHQKNISLDSQGRKNGYSMILGLSGAFSYNFTGNDQTNKADDWIAAVEVVGTTLDLTTFVSGVKIRMSLDVYGDVAMVRSYALDKLRATEGEEQLTTTLRNHNYYHSWGITTFANIEVSKGRFSAGANVRDSNYQAVLGHDQFQDLLVKEFKGKDSISTGEIWAAVNVSKNWKLKVSYQTKHRSGEINGDYFTESVEKRIKGTLMYRF